MPNFTTEDLIQFVYQETSNEKAIAIRKAVEENWELKEKLDALQDSLRGLDEIVESPRPQSIEAILNYARNTAAVEQH
ncbi:hypothetical protein EXU57_20645 [Segetibacter sp. 3557_3]|uniref:hypothetical protein n=1 Tax=Segetibacter sp. 3557_3 TaxID=2547429 RepID=UPI0010591573|nr:hypothetical protein [Segetibacter sp. 3557_3]TDH20807.1 hypothetical protein EXU57_20645 [Segetibacter sp. 3557_3]